jgi:malate/lactate dehydrogenase
MKISIIGAAGNVGSNAAFNIAIHKVTDELVMIDAFSPDKLNQYVYDLQSTATGMDIQVQAGNYADLARSDIVIVAAGSANVVASRMGALPQNLHLLRDFAAQIKRFCPGAVVITATNPVCPLNYAMYLLTGFDRRRLIGFSANDSIRFRMFLGEALGIPSSRVEADVIGEHGNSQVLLFSSARVDGKKFSVPEEIQAKVREQVANLPNVMEDLRMKTGRTSAWTTAMGLAALCRAIAHDTRRKMPCSIVLDGEYGYRRLSMSVSVTLGREGVLEIEQRILAPAEREGLARSVETLRPAMKYVEEFVRK